MSYVHTFERHWEHRSPFERLQAAIVQEAELRQVVAGRELYCWCRDWDPEKHGHLESCRRIRAAYYNDRALLELHAEPTETPNQETNPMSTTPSPAEELLDAFEGAYAPSPPDDTETLRQRRRKGLARGPARVLEAFGLELRRDHRKELGAAEVRLAQSLERIHARLEHLEPLLLSVEQLEKAEQERAAREGPAQLERGALEAQVARRLELLEGGHAALDDGYESMRKALDCLDLGDLTEQSARVDDLGARLRLLELEENAHRKVDGIEERVGELEKLGADYLGTKRQVEDIGRRTALIPEGGVESMLELHRDQGAHREDRARLENLEQLAQVAAEGQAELRKQLDQRVPVGGIVAAVERELEAQVAPCTEALAQRLQRLETILGEHLGETLACGIEAAVDARREGEPDQVPGHLAERLERLENRSSSHGDRLLALEGAGATRRLAELESKVHALEAGPIQTAMDCAAGASPGTIMGEKPARRLATVEDLPGTAGEELSAGATLWFDPSDGLLYASATSPNREPVHRATVNLEATEKCRSVRADAAGNLSSVGYVEHSFKPMPADAGAVLAPVTLEPTAGLSGPELLRETAEAGVEPEPGGALIHMETGTLVHADGSTTVIPQKPPAAIAYGATDSDGRTPARDLAGAMVGTFAPWGCGPEPRPQDRELLDRATADLRGKLEELLALVYVAHPTREEGTAYVEGMVHAHLEAAHAPIQTRLGQIQDALEQLTRERPRIEQELRNLWQELERRPAYHLPPIPEGHHAVGHADRWVISAKPEEATEHELEELERRVAMLERGIPEALEQRLRLLERRPTLEELPSVFDGLHPEDPLAAEEQAARGAPKWHGVPGTGDLPVHREPTTGDPLPELEPTIGDPPPGQEPHTGDPVPNPTELEDPAAVLEQLAGEDDSLTRLRHSQRLHMLERRVRALGAWHGQLGDRVETISEAVGKVKADRPVLAHALGGRIETVERRVGALEDAAREAGAEALGITVAQVERNIERQLRDTCECEHVKHGEEGCQGPPAFEHRTALGTFRVCGGCLAEPCMPLEVILDKAHPAREVRRIEITSHLAHAIIGAEELAELEGQAAGHYHRDVPRETRTERERQWQELVAFSRVIAAQPAPQLEPAPCTCGARAKGLDCLETCASLDPEQAGGAP